MTITPKKRSGKTVKTAFFTLSLGATLLVSGCAAMDTAMNHQELDVQSKMSDSIFLDPVPGKDKTIYVQIRNTSGEKLALRAEIESQLKADGWNVVRDVEKAHDMLQVNVLQAGKAKNPESVWSSIADGYGSAVAAGTLAGLASGYAVRDAGTGLAVGGLIGIGSWVADSLVKNVTYSVISDVQVSTRTNGKVTQSTEASLSQGNSTHVSQMYQEKSNWMRYRTRVASVAEKMNLKFPEAAPLLTQKIASEISGMFTG